MRNGVELVRKNMKTLTFIDCGDLFCKIYCSFLNNLFCKIGPFTVSLEGIEGCNCTSYWVTFGWLYSHFHKLETGIDGYIHDFDGWNHFCNNFCLTLNKIY